MRGHGASCGLSGLIEGEGVVAKPVLGSDGVEFIRFAHGCYLFFVLDFGSDQPMT